MSRHQQALNFLLSLNYVNTDSTTAKLDYVTVAQRTHTTLSCSPHEQISQRFDLDCRQKTGLYRKEDEKLSK